MSEGLLVARKKEDICILPKMSNRHGLITGATGTGKTVTLQVLAENFSSIGVPVFLADVKGDLSGLTVPGEDKDAIKKRLKEMGIKDFEYRGFPVTFWDVFGKNGHPIRTTVSEIGPLLFSRLLGLNETQTGTLTLVFKVADDAGMLLLDLKDLRAMVQFVGDHASEFTTEYGRVSTASIGAIQRGLLAFQEEGGDALLGEPAINLEDMMQTGDGGYGMINILAADRLIQTPKVYSTLLLWLLSELFEELPEVGDPEKPRLVFFFDEAHLLFDDTPKALQDKIEQVVRIIRSKGVGVYFVTQHPNDIPDEILAQLGNRVQHALRAYTPKEQKAVKAAAESFRVNPAFDTEQAITELSVGEALLSFLDKKGIPGMVERALVRPPHSQLGPITPGDRTRIITDSPVYGAYEEIIDRESAYEKLKSKAEKAADEKEKLIEKKETKKSSSRKDTVFEAAFKSAARSIGYQVGRQIARGVLGSIFKGR
ncbi:MAG: DUF853 family protein [Acidobacteria bacterium]|nr:DUF853 family protein [Acidobacteriota bacterium]